LENVHERYVAPLRAMLTGFAICAGLLAVFGIYCAVIALFVRDGVRMIVAGLAIALRGCCDVTVAGPRCRRGVRHLVAGATSGASKSRWCAEPGVKGRHVRIG
jgi:hypothetical protein